MYKDLRNTVLTDAAEVTGQEFQIIKEHLEKFHDRANSKP